MSRTTYLLGTISLAAFIAAIVGGMDGIAGFFLGASAVSVWYETRKEERAKRQGE